MTITSGLQGSGASKARRALEQLDHPIVDGDGHILEFLPAVLPHVRSELGPQQFERFRKAALPVEAMVTGATDLADARTSRLPQGAWWATPTNARDLATAALPELLHDRMDEIAIDYAILYPTKALGAAAIEDDDLRIGVCRGFNNYYAETYGRFQDRFRVAGVIPMTTPKEACEALRHAHALGLRVVVMPDGVVRRIERPVLDTLRMMPGQTHWLDTFGLDSLYDYDPVWRLAVELGLAVTFHVGVGSVIPRVTGSISNYTANHLGFFAERMQHLCKSLFMGGVTERFPTARFAFLESGCLWACALCCDLVEHWERRNITTLSRTLDPARIDWEEMQALVRRYGGPLTEPLSTGEVLEGIRRLPARGMPPEDHDDWKAIGAGSPDELMSRFTDSVFFGCEAGERGVSTAFSSVIPSGRKLRPIFSSDMGHWDAGDLFEVVPEAVSLLEEGLVDEVAFEEFAFSNAVRLFGGPDPSFFNGTSVEGPARAVLSGIRDTS